MTTTPEKCPKCGAGDVEHGYGLWGGGIGPYWFCIADECDWFRKEQDEEHAEPTP